MSEFCPHLTKSITVSAMAVECVSVCASIATAAMVLRRVAEIMNQDLFIYMYIMSNMATVVFLPNEVSMLARTE